MFFTLVMPPAFFLLFGGLSAAYHSERAGLGNVSAYLMISFAVYGSMSANTSAGASVAVERALGWSRQLRLTPLSPVAYVAIKSSPRWSSAPSPWPSSSSWAGSAVRGCPAMWG